jgi:hypothetical protein
LILSLALGLSTTGAKLAHFARHTRMAGADDRGMVDRERLLWHMDYFFRPPARFYDELERAIELAAEGRSDELTEIEGARVPVSELIDTYLLEEFVEEARSGGGPEGDGDASIVHRDAEDYGGC